MRTEPTLRFGPVLCGVNEVKMIASPAGVATAPSASSRRFNPMGGQPVV